MNETQLSLMESPKAAIKFDILPRCMNDLSLVMRSSEIAGDKNLSVLVVYTLLTVVFSGFCYTSY